MTRDELLKRLRDIAARKGRDTEVDHGDADDLLIEYINDEEIKQAYDAIDKWYA